MHMERQHQNSRVVFDRYGNSNYDSWYFLTYTKQGKNKNNFLYKKFKMEQCLEKTLNEIVSGPNTTGCLFANKQGLCLGAKGKATADSAGIAVAISEQACKLEPNSNPPIISLESGNKTCLIHKYGGITGVIYKQNANQR